MLLGSFITINIHIGNMRIGIGESNEARSARLKAEKDERDYRTAMRLELVYFQSGSPPATRQEMIDRFNAGYYAPHNIFHVLDDPSVGAELVERYRRELAPA